MPPTPIRGHTPETSVSGAVRHGQSGQLYVGLEIDDPEVGNALLQRVGDDAAVAAGGIGLEAQQRRGRAVLELRGEAVERLRRGRLDVRAVGGRRLRDPARVEQVAQVGRRPERAPVLVRDPVVAEQLDSRVFDIPGRRDWGRKRTSITRSTRASRSSLTSCSGSSRS